MTLVAVNTLQFEMIPIEKRNIIIVSRESHDEALEQYGILCRMCFCSAGIKGQNLLSP